jgi:intracellular septation protein
MIKVFFDLLPVILFFVGFKLFNIFVATAIAIGTTLALIVYSHFVLKKVDKMLLVNGAIISILGGITLALHDKTFIMWKPTVLYWIGAVALLISNFVFKKNLIQQMMKSILNPPERIWQTLNWIWIGFLIGLGFLNLYVAFHYSEKTWVNFKVFGVTSMLFVFMIVQTIILRRYLVQPSDIDSNQIDKD